MLKSITCCIQDIYHDITDIMINTNNIINDINDITEQFSHNLDCSLVCGIPRLKITYASSFGPDILQSFLWNEVSGKIALLVGEGAGRRGRWVKKSKLLIIT